MQIHIFQSLKRLKSETLLVQIRDIQPVYIWRWWQGGVGGEKIPQSKVHSEGDNQKTRWLWNKLKPILTGLKSVQRRARRKGNRNSKHQETAQTMMVATILEVSD
jgi:hypothetical protein